MALDVYLVGAVHEGEPSREMVRTIVRLAKEKGLPVGLESHPKIWEITPSLDKGYWKKLEKVLKENEVRVEYLGSPETLRRVAKRLGKTPQEITCVPLFQYLVAELTGDLEVLLRTHMRAGEFYLHVLEQEKAILEKVAEREENLILVMGRAHTDYLAVVKCKEVKGKELRFEYVGREVEKEVTYLQDLLEYEPPPHLFQKESTLDESKILNEREYVKRWTRLLGGRITEGNFSYIGTLFPFMYPCPGVFEIHKDRWEDVDGTCEVSGGKIIEVKRTSQLMKEQYTFKKLELRVEGEVKGGLWGSWKVKKGTFYSKEGEFIMANSVEKLKDLIIPLSPSPRGRL